MRYVEYEVVPVDGIMLKKIYVFCDLGKGLFELKINIESFQLNTPTSIYVQL